MFVTQQRRRDVPSYMFLVLHTGQRETMPKRTWRAGAQ